MLSKFYAFIARPFARTVQEKFFLIDSAQVASSHSVLMKVFKLSRSDQNTLPVMARNAKLMEEVGEFSQALMFGQGYLPHKTVEEPLVGEAADVILCVLDTYAAAYPELSPEELAVNLVAQLEKKSAKWDRVMRVRADLVNRE